MKPAMIEAVVLTGGASSRMGSDKAKLIIEGTELAERIAIQLQTQCSIVTILGRAPIKGYSFISDESDFAGPLTALAGFSPQEPFVFVASCDLVLFDERLVEFLSSILSTNDAAMPFVQGFVQPLCGLYRSVCWKSLRLCIENGSKSIMAWIDQLQVARADDHVLQSAGIDPRSALGANSPQQLAELTRNKGVRK